MEDSEREEGRELGNPALTEELVEDVEKLKGDAIGSTLYSSRFVLKTLMRLAQEPIEWTEDLEEELCLLWDMSIEKEVVGLLLEADAFALARHVLERGEEPRLREIMVGLVGNMCCVEEAREALAREPQLQTDVVQLLGDSDGPTMVQALRLLNTVAWHPPPDTWLHRLLQAQALQPRLAFVLVSSTNEELLTTALSFLYTLSSSSYTTLLCSKDLVLGLLECWTQLFSSWSPAEDLPSTLHQQAATHWTAILLAIAQHQPGLRLLCEEGSKLGPVLEELAALGDPQYTELSSVSLMLLAALLPAYFRPGALGPLARRLAVTPADSQDEDELRSQLQAYGVRARRLCPGDQLAQALLAHPHLHPFFPDPDIT